MNGHILGLNAERAAEVKPPFNLTPLFRKTNVRTI
jgi:hypothetical protein